jgi:uncharacterized SAM-binding protein YcdF (DUF218 family)
VFGLLEKKERWSLSGTGWMVSLLVLIVIGYFGLTHAYTFLALTDRVDTDTLVVEGWVHSYAARAAVAEFDRGKYRSIFTTGGPVVGNGGYVNDFQTAASVGAQLLRRAGIPQEVLQMVPTHVMGQDRTYSSAVALRKWFDKHHLQVRSLNIITEGAHARRTRLLFQEALGRNVKVGVIAVPSPDFDAMHWWRYSEGVEDVINEGIGYLYAKFFFYPAAPSRQQ